MKYVFTTESTEDNRWAFEYTCESSGRTIAKGIFKTHEDDNELDILRKCTLAATLLKGEYWNSLESIYELANGTEVILFLRCKRSGRLTFIPNCYFYRKYPDPHSTNGWMKDVCVERDDMYYELKGCRFWDVLGWRPALHTYMNDIMMNTEKD